MTDTRPPSFDFRAHQARARRQTAILITLFIAIAVVISAIVGALAAAFLAVDSQPGEFTGDQVVRQMLTPGSPAQQMWLGVALVTMAIILGTAAFRALWLGDDGGRIAEKMGGTRIDESTRNPAARRFHNIVSEMALASNLPMPKVYVMKHESGINAFAAGTSPEKAAVAVTHGALATLNRTELTGVVAHEFAHIANADMRINIRLMALIFGLVAIYVIGRGVLRGAVFSRIGGGRRDGRAVAAMMAIGAALAVLGLLGVVGGRVLQAAVSRQREYLADATAVQYTRDPNSIAGALKKIRALKTGAKLNSHHTEEIEHMLFADGLNRSFTGLMATHPPLEKRIRAIDPSFDPDADPPGRASHKDLAREVHRELGPWGAA